jgi:hypothetical protein
MAKPFESGEAEDAQNDLRGILALVGEHIAANPAWGSVGETELIPGSLTGIGLTAIINRWIEDNPFAFG